MNTKVMSYIETVESGKVDSQQDRIVELLAGSNNAMTRTEIAEQLGIRRSSVCGRINELIHAGVVVVSDTAYDKDSDRVVEAVSLYGQFYHV